LRVSYHIGVRVVTHSQVAFTPYKQLARLNRVDRAGRRCQCHSLVDRRAFAHDRDAADLQSQTASFLRGAEQAGVLAAVALWVLFHLALGPAEDADLKGLLVRDEAAIVATATHDCRRGCCRHGRRERRRPGTVVVGGAVVVVRTDGGVGVAGVGVEVASDLSLSEAHRQ
jgi:hypothetical protein